MTLTCSLYLLSPGGVGCQIGSGGLSWLTPWGTASHPTAWLHFQTMLKPHWMPQWRRIGSLPSCQMGHWHQLLPWEGMTSALPGQSRAKTLVRHNETHPSDVRLKRKSKSDTAPLSGTDFANVHVDPWIQNNFIQKLYVIRCGGGNV